VRDCDCNQDKQGRDSEEQDDPNRPCSKTFNTTYTNSSDVTIVAIISVAYSGFNGGFAIYVNGMQIAHGGGNAAYKYGEVLTFPIPAGATYRIDLTNATITHWAEFA